MTLAEAQRVVLPDARLAVSKRFGRFKDEDEKAVRTPAIVRDETLEQLTDAWKRFGAKYKEINWSWLEEGPIKKYYGIALSLISDIHYSTQDVEKFSIALAEFQDTDFFAFKAGLFLSALINNCPESEFVIHTSHLYGIVSFLGFYNKKNISVDGDIGDNLAKYMSGGKITVQGNAGNNAGIQMNGGEIVINGNSDLNPGCRMKGGKITVKGNAEGYAGIDMKNGEIVVEGDCCCCVGDGMKGGKITFKGNAGWRVGEEMAGGEIRLEGEYKSLGRDQKGGKIYHEGKLIFSKEGQK